ncbi:protein translocase subunit SecD [Halanaerobium sp. Z-7514]|uniref:Protein translocase subunit SecD n=1 Tax=Halanaerobium polyolivorans TaxID=2886943 RepID=A0AAW4X0P4_9FIRM|nr:protein translocase subunit SecD [Halanaerobium polyolivorans]MCC3145364.1 protein translocase subunit SecD [Halanaerobium polyolivorans]RQD72318.1 MAG: protein translocase subunit SecD [Halanaerobium sp. MSAO_Bac5]
MRYKQKRRIKFIIILAIIAFSLFLFLHYGINLGLDLQGGAQITLQAQPTEDREIDDSVMAGIVGVIERRVNQLGLSEPLIQREGSDRILVELPAVDNPNQAIETIGRTAMLTFRNDDGDVLMSGEAVRDARADHDQYGRAVVSFTLTSEGSDRFANITREYMGRRIGIYLDDEQLTNPTVQAVIEERGQITGYDSVQEAEEHAILIREGALPVPVEVIETRTVGPTLGSIAIQRSIIAGLIGLLIVGAYMIYYYRFPGVLAAGVLAIYGAMLMGTLAGLQAVLTLPGIAGLILSIGMAVDANIIIFERIKDEMKSGKTLRAAVDSGFKRAYITILDANVTTIITALILAYFTSGTVRGFAVTLGIGIVVSMFTAFFVTRNVIDIFTGSKLMQAEKAFGVRKG